MKKGINSIILFLIVFILCNSVFFCQNAFAEDNTKSDCESYALVDAETGQVLLGQKENTVMVPASTTKVMTAIIVLENSKLTDKVTVGENPERAEGTSIGLKKGNQYTVENLLHGLLLESANDCAEALAEHVGGTRQHFIEMMNKKAQDLKVESLDDLFEDEPKTEKPDVKPKLKSENKVNAPILPMEENEEEEEMDLQKELEAKFDELFGPIEDE